MSGNRRRPKREIRKTCPQCGREFVDSTRPYRQIYCCLGCRDAATIIRAKEQNRRYREQRKAAGMCVDCGRRPAAPGHTRCDGCMERRSLYARERLEVRRSMGYCAKCQKRKAIPGRSECAECSGKRLALRKARIAEGLCVTCGKVPPIEGQRECQKCAARHSRQARNWQKVNEETGWCVSCGKRPAFKGRQKCIECIRKSNTRDRKRKGAETWDA